MVTIPEAISTAVARYEQGDMGQVEQICRKVIAVEPRSAEAWHLLGVATHVTGRHAEAVESISHAITIDGANSSYHDHLGAAFAALNNFEAAETSFRRALALNPSAAQVHYNLAALLNLRGQPANAIAGYRRAIELNPQLAEAHFNLGNLLRTDGQLAEAEACFAAASAASPNYVKALMGLAGVQLQQQKSSEAEMHLRRVVALDPGNIDALVRLGSLLDARGDTAAAVETLRAAVFHDPHHFQAQNNLGCIYRRLDQPGQAEQCFRMALTADPNSAVAWSNLGAVLQDKKDTDAAATCYRRAIELQPDFIAAHTNLGAIRQEQKQFDAAVEHYRNALALQPDSADALSNIGSALQTQGKASEAIEYHRRALEINPNHKRAHYCLGGAMHFLDRDDEALACYANAIRVDPNFFEAKYYRAFVWLSQGKLAAGWQDYESRLKCKDFKGRRYNEPKWDGAPLAGRTLLIHAEQGLGDTLQFIRYVKLAEQKGGAVLTAVQPALVPLLATSGFKNLLPGGSQAPAFDVQIPMMSLPGVFGTTLESIPAEVPYLSADPKLVDRWREALRSYTGFKVGIVWQGNAAYTFDHLRSIPLIEFAPLAGISNVQLISLQKNSGTEQLAAAPARFTALELGDTLDNDTGAFMDTAAVIRNLDVVITSDTATAHLAGGLGVPVWLAVSAAPEWRWMKERSDSPWYPNMRLFRQSRIGEWSGVFSQIATELAKFVAQRPETH